ncbi:guanine nucleotide-binding protein G(I)/G(S)/G(O) subunit gamma-12-like protein [Apostichopus japonicus]|uniref:Guanine nucleotide-binding protein subunit gamma n=1 Tax=Stichopus japonicus TaxID=307972 RepID=A0A2G8JI81_STIJA|nr:guanine nucleotide-binding protein G(I)/G(S)/G(O) subunit gamma-12-like protein [Apostichopus japonicus]
MLAPSLFDMLCWLHSRVAGYTRRHSLPLSIKRVISWQHQLGIKEDGLKIALCHYIFRSRAATISNLKRAVEQLRRESGVNRFKVSVACTSLVEYCDKQQHYDMLLTGVPPNNGENPFKDRRPCRLL